MGYLGCHVGCGYGGVAYRLLDWQHLHIVHRERYSVPMNIDCKCHLDEKAGVVFKQEEVDLDGVRHGSQAIRDAFIC